MINEPLYHKTISILTNAYFNDTLVSQDCTKCGVGNLIAAANNYKAVILCNELCWMDTDGNYITPQWLNVTGTIEKKLFEIVLSKKQFINVAEYHGEARAEIESTGYKLHEFAMIENAFETGYRGKDKMFNALMKVVDVLDIIHENNDPVVSKLSKLSFRKILS